MLSTIQHDLHTSQGTVTWVLTVFLLSASIFTPILGRVGDMVGKERMLVVTLLALAAGTVLAGLAQSIGVLIVARAIQGIGGAVLPLSFGIIRDEFPAAKVATGVGHRGGHGRGRGRGRHRPGRAHRQPPQLPLAVLDPADHLADRRGVRPLLRPRVTGPDTRQDQLAGRRCSCRAGWWPCSSA